MSDRMHPLSFEELMTAIAAEYQREKAVFGQRSGWKADPSHAWELFGGRIETPFGPAAGPHTQLAQNIVAAYVNGSRFFELKTVQKLDGEDLPVSKPCILAEDEGYNVEWSTELYVDEAFEEYVKAWFALHVLARELQLGSPDGFLFNMSVGYDLDGIRSDKIDRFIEGLKDASGTKIFRDCRNFLKKRLHNFRYFNAEDLDAIPAQICSSITLSTLHGCPAGEIEKIATYLLTEKGLHTYIKCNPTLLGYEFARDTLNNMGYDYVSFTDFHFKDDLQYEDAIPMLRRLQDCAASHGRSFGVKITNTFPVEIRGKELPGEEMYMSGRALYPLSIALAAKLSEEFNGKLRISYSGGADIHTIGSIVSAGIWPVTIATTVLKPGGYGRMKQIAEEFASMQPQRIAMSCTKECETGSVGAPADADADRIVNPAAVRTLADDGVKSVYHCKSIKVKTRHNKKTSIPLVDCFLSPCREGCPIRQDIPAYLKLVEEERYDEALSLIMTKNPLPFTTGSICPHTCMDGCTRSFYESSVRIREAKLLAAKRGFEEVFAALSPAESVSMPHITAEGDPAAADTADAARKKDEKIAVVGGGPAGMAVAHFLARAGKQVTIFTASEELGGIPLHVIPEFRISSELVRRDISFLIKLGVDVKVRTRIDSLDDLKDYGTVILATGASKNGELPLKGGNAINALTFLHDFKKSDGKVEIGKNVAVIGGGNTAMDTARAAIRTQGVEKVYLVYRRNVRYMPADEEELKEALADGVTFCELMSPVSFSDGVLHCECMKLGDPDASGRRSPVPNGEFKDIPVDTVIAAIGEKVDGDFYAKCNIPLTERGLPQVDPATMESARKGVYVIGDGRRGPGTVVEAIADAMACAEHILGKKIALDIEPDASKDAIYEKKGVIAEPSGEHDYKRCLNCSVICENCVDVCPNRANIAVNVVGMEMPQVIHVDRLCNECGNCATFCPYEGAPYKEKLTLFETLGDMDESDNNGFCFYRPDRECVVLRLYGKTYSSEEISGLISQGVDASVVRLIEAVFRTRAFA